MKIDFINSYLNLKNKCIILKEVIYYNYILIIIYYQYFFSKN